MEKLELSYTAGGNEKWFSHFRKLSGSFQKLKRRVTIESSIFTSGYRTKRNETICLHKILYMNIHSSILHSSQKVETDQCPLTDEWIDRMGHICTIKCYSAMKINEVLIHTTTWMNLKHLTLIEGNSHKCHILYASIIWNVQNRQIYGDREQINGCLELEGWRNWELAAKGYRVSFWGGKNILKLIVVMIAQL